MNSEGISTYTRRLVLEISTMHGLTLDRMIHPLCLGDKRGKAGDEPPMLVAA